MKELRCMTCNKLLCRYNIIGDIEILCYNNKCRTLNLINVTREGIVQTIPANDLESSQNSQELSGGKPLTAQLCHSTP